MKRYTVEDIRRSYGEEPQMSEWFLVEQEHIDQFGQATLDSDWMHVNPERAKRDGPFGGTVAFGFWTRSASTRFARGRGTSRIAQLFPFRLANHNERMSGISAPHPGPSHRTVLAH